MYRPPHFADVCTGLANGLNRVAYSQDGYFTSRQAGEHGFSAQLLALHVRSGRYERIRRGLYRLRDYPGSPHAASGLRRDLRPDDRDLGDWL
jgi:hypothetical protein